MPAFNPHATPFRPAAATPASLVGSLPSPPPPIRSPPALIDLEGKGDQVVPAQLVHHVNRALVLALAGGGLSLLQMHPHPHSAGWWAVFVALSSLAAKHAVTVLNSGVLPWKVEAAVREWQEGSEDDTERENVAEMGNVSVDAGVGEQGGQDCTGRGEKMGEETAGESGAPWSYPSHIGGDIGIPRTILLVSGGPFAAQTGAVEHDTLQLDTSTQKQTTQLDQTIEHQLPLTDPAQPSRHPPHPVSPSYAQAPNSIPDARSFYYGMPYPYYYDPPAKPLQPFVSNPFRAMPLVPGMPPITIFDDDGQPIQVNPCRVFVGNIPFQSTWPSLKNFLVAAVSSAAPAISVHIRRVEIPMHKPSESDMAPRLSRGFAIVTTGDQASSDILIEHTNNAVFEGRALTVRYDRFPDFNNYVVQQLFPRRQSFDPSPFPYFAGLPNCPTGPVRYGANWAQAPYTFDSPTAGDGSASPYSHTSTSGLDLAPGSSRMADSPASESPSKHKPKRSSSSPRKPSRSKSKLKMRASQPDSREEKKSRGLNDSFSSLGIE